MGKVLKYSLLGLAGVSIFSIATAGLVIAVDNKNSTSSNNVSEVRILSTNDIHGRLVEDSFTESAGIHSLAGWLTTQDYDMLLDAGDLIQGTALNDVDQGHTIAGIAADMGYDAIAVGNHEFDFGIDNVTEIDAMEGVDFLSANTRRKDNNERVFEASKIITLEGGIKAGIIGLTTPSTAVTTHPDNVTDINFTSIVEEATTEIAALEEQGINFIIGLAHLGSYGSDSAMELANALTGKFDLIIDGHSQNDWNEVVQNEKGTTHVIQTGEHAKSIRSTTFEFNKLTGFIENFNSTNIPYSQIRGFEELASPFVTNAVAEIQAESDVLNGRVVLENAPIVTSFDNNRVTESPIARLVSDALVYHSKDGTTVEQHADFAFVNSGGVRATLKQGQLTREDIFNVLPFSNQLEVIEISGSKIREVIAFSLKNQNDGAWLAFSNEVKVVVNATILDATETNPPLIDPESITAMTISINGEGLDDQKMYKVATNDFLLTGGDGYEMLNARIPANNIKTVATHGDFLNTLENYLNYLVTPEAGNLWVDSYSLNSPIRIDGIYKNANVSINNAAALTAIEPMLPATVADAASLNTHLQTQLENETNKTIIMDQITGKEFVASFTTSVTGQDGSYTIVLGLNPKTGYKMNPATLSITGISIPAPSLM